MTLTLTDRDLTILEALVFQVRLLTVRLVAELWWPGGLNQRQARKRLEQLSKWGFVEFHVINTCHSMMQVKEPIFTWKANGDEPDFERLAKQCRERWDKATKPTTVCVASNRSATLLGSAVSGLPMNDRWDYDLRLSCVYAKYQQQSPAPSGRWIGSHSLFDADAKLKRLDACLINENGQILRAIKSAGRNDAKRLQSFHQHCIKHQLSYELW